MLGWRSWDWTWGDLIEGEGDDITAHEMNLPRVYCPCPSRSVRQCSLQLTCDVFTLYVLDPRHDVGQRRRELDSNQQHSCLRIEATTPSILLIDDPAVENEKNTSQDYPADKFNSVATQVVLAERKRRA